MISFPFADYWGLYAGFLGFVLLLLGVDLGVFQKTPHRPTFKEAAGWSLVWISLAGFLNLALWFYGREVLGEATGNRLALEFFAGYVVEKCLAVDNIFVFALVFTSFSTPIEFQHKILFWGILGALIFRGVFIAMGSVLMQYHWVVIGFGVLLIVTGIKLLFEKGEPNPADHGVVRFVKRFYPVAEDDGKGSFFRRINGVFCVTPIFLALLVIEFSDIVFAVDSVPAIFALTNEPFIVFTSNIMAILGLRSLYFMIAGSLEKFSHIKYGLAAVLVFVGLKMSWLNNYFDGKFPLGWSLGIIAVLIGGSIISSLFANKKAEDYELRGKSISS